jgi:hypothetical protein
MAARELTAASSVGIAVYVHNTLQASVLDCDEEDCGEEVLWLSIRLTTYSDLRLGCFYRSPNSTEHNDSTLWDSLRTVSSHSPGHFLVMGDFNLPDINWETWQTTDNNNNNNNLFLLHAKIVFTKTPQCVLQSY